MSLQVLLLSSLILFILSKKINATILRIDNTKNVIYWRNNMEYVQVEAYGKDSIRVRMTKEELGRRTKENEYCNTNRHVLGCTTDEK